MAVWRIVLFLPTVYWYGVFATEFGSNCKAELDITGLNRTVVVIATEIIPVTAHIRGNIQYPVLNWSLVDVHSRKPIYRLHSKIIDQNLSNNEPYHSSYSIKFLDDINLLSTPSLVQVEVRDKDSFLCNSTISSTQVEFKTSWAIKESNLNVSCTFQNTSNLYIAWKFVVKSKNLEEYSHTYIQLSNDPDPVVEYSKYSEVNDTVTVSIRLRSNFSLKGKDVYARCHDAFATSKGSKYILITNSDPTQESMEWMQQHGVYILGVLAGVMILLLVMIGILIVIDGAIKESDVPAGEPSILNTSVNNIEYQEIREVYSMAGNVPIASTSRATTSDFCM